MKSYKIYFFISFEIKRVKWTTSKTDHSNDLKLIKGKCIINKKINKRLITVLKWYAFFFLLYNVMESYIVIESHIVKGLFSLCIVNIYTVHH